MAGYYGYSKSNNAIYAEDEFKFPKTTFKKVWGINPEDYMNYTEYHHTSKHYNITYYYCSKYLFDEFVAKTDEKNLDKMSKRNSFDEFVEFLLDDKYFDEFDFKKLPQKIEILIKNILKDIEEERNEKQKLALKEKEIELKKLNTFDKDGYNYLGYNVDGYNKNGYDKHGYNFLGFDKNGYNAKGYDKNGFNRKGYNNLGYDKDGFKKNKFNDKGIHKDTGTQYDLNGFDKRRRHKLTGGRYDKNGFDKNGFNNQGIHKITTKYYDLGGYDVYGYNENGYDKYGSHKSRYYN